MSFMSNDVLVSHSVGRATRLHIMPIAIHTVELELLVGEQFTQIGVVEVDLELVEGHLVALYGIRLQYHTPAQQWVSSR